MYPNFALLLLLNAQNEILLLRRINTPFGNCCYSLPDTLIKFSETARTAIVRKSKKSLNIAMQPDDLEFVRVMYRKCNEPEFFACVFRSKNYEGIPHNQDQERYDDMCWFSVDKLPENMVPAHRHAIEQIEHSAKYSEHGWHESNQKTLKANQLEDNKVDYLFCQQAHSKNTVCIA